MKVQLIRNASLIISINDKKILVDPMLGAKGSLGKFPWIDDMRANPLTDLPFSEYELKRMIDEVDAVLLTHLHPDHWDNKAQEMLPKNIPIFCQPEDAEQIELLNFTNVKTVSHSTLFGNIELFRTEGKHGLGEIGNLMGNVSGFVIRHDKETLYLTGDTIWCNDVMDAINLYAPSFIIVNGGGAKFDIGEHVTMNCTDIKKLAEYNSHYNIAVVHLESVSPVTETRKVLKTFLSENALLNRVIIPDDGEEFRV